MRNKLPLLNVILSDTNYAKHNCYISQILEKLQTKFEVNRIFVNSRLPLSRLKVSDFPTLSLLQMRTLHRKRAEINKLLKSKEILIYDQDPWESFMDEGSIKGAYLHLANELNVRSFLTTSKWWTNHIKKLGFDVDYVQMGVLDRYCYKSFDFVEREFPVFFQGTLHEYREDFFQDLQIRNIDVEILPSANYQVFISNLRRAKIFLHISPSNWKLNGGIIQSNCCWIKDLEAVSQGCLSIRNIDEEYTLQGIDSIPAIKTFRNIDQVKILIESINEMSSKEVKEITEYSRNYVVENMNWNQIVLKIREFEKFA